MNQPLSLYQLNAIIHEVIDSSLDAAYWVVGELSDARQGANGHFYGELIEKGDDGRTITARARVNCWARQYNILRPRFIRESGQDIRAGMKVMMQVRVTYHEAYGLALHMLDIDATYTMGDLMQRRQAILRKLEEDGVIDDNKTLHMPRLLQRIAIVSAEGAAGYGDFIDQLHHNEYRLRFTTRLFPAVMQGQHVEESVIAALSAIEEEYDRWDAVVIIRGGGATSDLADFDSYPLAHRIACMPLPVIVGIGHERDETVLDHVAHTRVKTPTAAAALLIDHQCEELSALAQLQERILQSTRQRLHAEHMRLQSLAQGLPLRFATLKEREGHYIDRLWLRLIEASRRRLDQESHRIDITSLRLKALDPALLLERGYTMTTVGNTIITSPQQVKKGDVITTRLKQGTIYSTVITTEQ